MQSKLLRVIEEKEFERLGGNTIIPLRARIIASTNSDLELKMAEGQFREDLYYRLSVLELNIPPLRKRREDIVPLVKHFLNMTGSQRTFSQEALDLLKSYDWPGNVRQLRNLVTKLSIMSPDEVSCFSRQDVQAVLNRTTARREAALPSPFGKEELRNAEKQRIVSALEESNYCIAATARRLGVSRNTLYNKIKKYAIDIRKIVR